MACVPYKYVSIQQQQIIDQLLYIYFEMHVNTTYSNTFQKTTTSVRRLVIFGTKLD